MALNTDKFCHLFSNFDLVVRSKGKNARNVATEEDLNGITKAQLKTLLKKAMEEYKLAQKLYKKYKISKDELYEAEWRVFELKTEIADEVTIDEASKIFLDNMIAYFNKYVVEKKKVKEAIKKVLAFDRGVGDDEQWFADQLLKELRLDE